VRFKNENCVYDNHPSLRQGSNTEYSLAHHSRQSTPFHRASSSSGGSGLPSRITNSRVAKSTNASTLTSQLSTHDVESIKNKIRDLEEQLTKATPRSISSPSISPPSNEQATSSRIGGTFYVNRDSSLFGQTQTITRSVTHKTRLFGQSHWINVIPLVSSRILCWSQQKY
jgi:hypothetical protein